MATRHSHGRELQGRAARRAAAQEEFKRLQATKRNRGPSVRTVGGIVATVVLVLGIVAFGLSRSRAVTQQAAGMTSPTALNPATALLPVGSRAPDFRLNEMYGAPYHLAAQRGHPVLLEFFAVWCPVCQGEAPIMTRVTKAYQSKGVRIWSVLANPYGRQYEDSGRTDLSLASVVDLAWYAHTFHVSHPQLVDPSFSATNVYGASAYPTIYVIDRNGIIRFASQGHTPYSALSKVLNRVMARKA